MPTSGVIGIKTSEFSTSIAYIKELKHRMDDVSSSRIPALAFSKDTESEGAAADACAEFHAKLKETCSAISLLMDNTEKYLSATLIAFQETDKDLASGMKNGGLK